MSCFIETSPSGKPSKVLAYNGKESQLYSSLLSIPFVENGVESLDLYGKLISLDFLKQKHIQDENGEPKLYFMAGNSNVNPLFESFANARIAYPNSPIISGFAKYGKLQEYNGRSYAPMNQFTPIASFANILSDGTGKNDIINNLIVAGAIKGKKSWGMKLKDTVKSYLADGVIKSKTSVLSRQIIDGEITKQIAPQPIIKSIIERLYKSGLPSNINLLSNEEVEAKIIELGGDATLVRQVVAWGGINSYRVTDDLENSSTITLEFENGSATIGEVSGIYDFLEEYEDKFSNPDFFIEIQDLKINPESQGKGLGKSLLKDTISYIIDRFGDVDIYLNAFPIGNKKLSAKELSDFYKEEGFNILEDEGSNVTMLRKGEQPLFQKLASIGIGITTGGFVNLFTREVYINKDNPNIVNSTLHEHGHLFLDWLSKNKPDHYNAGVSLISKNKSEAKFYIDKIAELYPNLKEGSEEWSSEILSTIIGDQGENLVNSKKKGSIKEWLNALWKYIVEALGLTDYTPEQISNMTLAEFGKVANIDVLKGEKIFTGVNGESNFNKWKGSNRLVEELDIQDVKTGEPIVAKVYHGTTNEFYEFDSSVKGNIKGHLGKVNYFTSDYNDAENNYLAEGKDLTSRVERRAEEIVYDLQELSKEDVLSEYPIITPEEYEQYINESEEDLANLIAERELKGDTEQVLDLYVKLNNPIVLGNGSTWFDALEIDETYLEESTQEIAEEYSISEQEAKDEYNLEIRERAIEKQGEGNKVIEALEQALFNNEYDSSLAFEILGDNYYEIEVDLDSIEKSLRKAKLYENENREIASNQVIADLFKNLGFDGIILTDVSERFKNMGLSKNTSHIHVFDEFNNQIKLADGSNVSFGETSDIRFNIIGEKGAQKIALYKTMLDEAKFMESNGVSYPEIEDKTRWYKYQGQWRMLSNEAIKAFKNITLPEINKKTNLKTILGDENVLLKMYPNLGGINVTIVGENNKKVPEDVKNALQSGNALYRSEQRHIYINLDLQNTSNDTKAESERLSREFAFLLIHEIQHAIQQNENMPKGGNLYTLLQKSYSLLKLDPNSVPYGQAKERINNRDKAKFSEEDNKILDRAISNIDAILSNNNQKLRKDYDSLMGEIDANIAQDVLKSLYINETDFNIVYSNMLRNYLYRNNISEQDILYIYESAIQLNIVGEIGAANLDDSLQTMSNLAIAKEMLVKKKSSKAIKNATGWEYSAPENKWKLELDYGTTKNLPQLRELSDNASFNRDYVNNVLYNVRNDGKYDIKMYNTESLSVTEGRKIEYKSLSKSDLTDMLGEELASDIIVGKGVDITDDWGVLYEEPSEKAFEINKKYKVDVGNAIKLLDIFVAPDLFKAYPKLKNLDVVVSPIKSGEAAWDGENIILTPQSAMKNDKYIRSVLIHEVQHFIQEQEGFATGGTTGTEFSYENELILTKYANSEKSASEFLSDPNVKYLLTESPEIKGIIEDKTKLQISLTLKDAKLSAYEKYKNLAGEVEARNVQFRSEMSKAKRLKTLLAETEDVAPEDKIYLYGSIVSSSEQSVQDKVIAKRKDLALAKLDGNESDMARISAKLSELTGEKSQQSAPNVLNLDTTAKQDIEFKIATNPKYIVDALIQGGYVQQDCSL